MKRNFLSGLMALLAFGAVTVSCQEKDDPNQTPGGDNQNDEKVLVAPALAVSSANVTLEQARESETALSLSWTDASNETGLSVSYTVYANLASKDLYTSPQQLPATTSLSSNFTHKALNDLCVALGVTAGETAELQFAVYAVPSDNKVESIISNTVKSSVKTYSEKIDGPATVYLRGSALTCGWDKDPIAVPSTSENVYELAGVELRLIPDDVGFKVYFSNDGSDSREVAQDPGSADFGDCKIFDTDAASLFQPARAGYTNGVYTINLNLNTLKLTITRTGDLPDTIDLPDDLYMKGDCLPWKWNTPTTLLSKTATGVYEAKGIVMDFGGEGGNGFKIFLGDGVWSPYIAEAETQDKEGVIKLAVIQDSEAPQVYPGKHGYEKACYDVVFDPSTMEMTLTGTEAPAPETAYIYGCCFEGQPDWAYWCELQSISSYVYKIEHLALNVGDAEYARGFKIYPAKEDWGNEYCMDLASTHDNIVFGLKSVVGDNQVIPFNLGYTENGLYTIVLDFNTKRVTLTKE